MEERKNHFYSQSDQCCYSDKCAPENVGPPSSEVETVGKCWEGFPPSFSLLVRSGFYLLLVKSSGNGAFLGARRCGLGQEVRAAVCRIRTASDPRLRLTRRFTRLGNHCVLCIVGDQIGGPWCSCVTSNPWSYTEDISSLSLRYTSSPAT